MDYSTNSLETFPGVIKVTGFTGVEDKGEGVTGAGRVIVMTLHCPLPVWLAARCSSLLKLPDGHKEARRVFMINHCC